MFYSFLEFIESVSDVSFTFFHLKYDWSSSELSKQKTDPFNEDLQNKTLKQN